MSDTADKTGTPSANQMRAALIMLGYRPEEIEVSPDELMRQYYGAVGTNQENEKGIGSGLNADGGPDEDGHDEDDAPPSLKAPELSDMPSPQAAMRGAPPRPSFGKGQPQQSKKAGGGGGSGGGGKRLLTDEQLRQAAAEAAGKMGAQVAAKLEASLKQVTKHINEQSSQAVQGAIDALTDHINETMAEVEARTERKVIIREPGQPPQEVTGQHEKFGDLLFNAKLREPTMLVGPTGSGKTTASRKVAEVLGLPFDYMALGPTQTEAKLFGYQSATGEYVPSSFYLRYRYGGVMLLDEMDAGNSGVLVSMNGAIQNKIGSFPRGHLSQVELNAARAAGLNGELKGWKVGETETGGVIEMHPDFVVIASANTYGKGGDGMYVGRQPIDAATFKRFKFIVWDYDEAFERQLAPLDEWTQLVQAVRASVANLKMLHAVSPVDSISGGKLILAGKPWRTVASETIFAGLKEDEIERVLRNGEHTFFVEKATNRMESWEYDQRLAQTQAQAGGERESN